jgi:hypothetical protein
MSLKKINCKKKTLARTVPESDLKSEKSLKRNKAILDLLKLTE